MEDLVGDLDQSVDYHGMREQEHDSIHEDGRMQSALPCIVLLRYRGISGLIEGDSPRNNPLGSQGAEDC